MTIFFTIPQRPSPTDHDLSERSGAPPSRSHRRARCSSGFVDEVSTRRVRREDVSVHRHSSSCGSCVARARSSSPSGGLISTTLAIACVEDARDAAAA